MIEDNSPLPAVVEEAIPKQDKIQKLTDEKLLEFLHARTDTLNQITRDAYHKSRPVLVGLGFGLIEAKARWGAHKKWIPWVHEHLPFDERMAQRYMKLAADWQQGGEKTLPKLSQSGSKSNTTRVSHFSFRVLEAANKAAQRPASPKEQKSDWATAEKVMKAAHHSADKLVSLGYDLLDRLDPESFEKLVAFPLRKLLDTAQKRLDRAHAVEAGESDEEAVEVQSVEAGASE